MRRLCAVFTALLLAAVICTILASCNPTSPVTTLPSEVTTPLETTPEETTPEETTPEETTPEETTPEETTPKETTPEVTEPDFSNPSDPDGTKRY